MAIGIRRRVRSMVKRTANRFTNRPSLGVVIAGAGLVKRALLCCLLLCPSFAQAQFTLELGSDPATSLLGSMLRDGFGQHDPSLSIVFSSQMPDADLRIALRTGALDIAIVSPLRAGLADDLHGMRFERIGYLVQRLAGVKSDMEQTGLGEIYALFPQSPSMEVRSFLKFVRSRDGAKILHTFGAGPDD